jgi:DNA-binding CsgD family transcriptional regulator
MADPAGDPLARLTDRQRDCLRLIARGHASDKEIAAALGISPETAKQHVAAARRTLNVPTRAQAARLLAAREESPPPPNGVNPSPELAPPVDVGAVAVDGRAWRRWIGPFGWLVPAYRGASNDLATGQRIVLLILLPLAIILVAAGTLSAVETLTRILGRLAG